MKKIWKFLMTFHIFGVYLIFIFSAFLVAFIYRYTVMDMYPDTTPSIIKLFSLVLFFGLAGFPGIISVIRKEYIRPVGQPKSGLMSVVGGVLYATMVYGTLLYIIISKLSQ